MNFSHLQIPVLSTIFILIAACGSGGGGAQQTEPGTFIDSGQSVGTSLTTLSIALGDIDGDGDLDLIEGNDNGKDNRIYFNDGVGNFTDSSQTLGANYTWSIAIGDLDGDGDLDLVAGNYYNSQANQVYLNNGAGMLADSGQTLGSSNTYAVALGDIDDDGDLDLVAGNYDQANRVYLNQTY